MAYLSNGTLRQTVALSTLRSNSSSWQINVGNHSWTLDKAPNTETSVLLTTLDLPRSSRTAEGTRLLRVELCYQISAAAATTFTPALYRQALAQHGGSLTVPQPIPISCDGAHDTNAKRISTGLHRLQLFSSEAKFNPTDEVCFLELSIQTNSSCVVQILALQLHYALRL